MSESPDRSTAPHSGGEDSPDRHSMVVMIVDDHPLLRAGVRSALSTDQTIKKIIEAEDGREALTKAVEERPNVIIMDLHLPVLDGLEAMRLIAESLPDVPFIVFSESTDKSKILQAVHLGARAYLRKDAEGGQIVNAVRSVMEGKVLLEGNLLRAASERGKQRAPSELSPLATKVWALKKSGLTRTKISQDLGIDVTKVDELMAEYWEKRRTT